MSKVFDSRLSSELDRATANRDKAKTEIARIYWTLRVKQLERRIPTPVGKFEKGGLK